jgi:predicted Zn-dependent protease
LAHAYFPENGDIHMNDNVNWSLSFYYQENTINMFYVIAHEIGHSLGLNHISDPNSIMFPAYIRRNADAFNFTFEPIDEQLIKTMYSNYHTTTEKITQPTVPTTTSDTEDFYPDFTLCKQKDINWCNDNLNFNLIYDIEGYLFLYKSIDFWIYSDKAGIKSRRFNHFDYWTSNFAGLISIIKIENDFVLFYETHAQILSCDRGELNLNYSRVNITNRINGVFYNESTDSLYLFSKETPRSYFKIYNARKVYAKTYVKPISLFKIDIYNYDLVFKRKNNVYFVKGNIIDYYDFDLSIIVKGIEFRDLFLRDQCDLSPLLNFRNYNIKYFDSRYI